jgi:hypothetical protein
MKICIVGSGFTGLLVAICIKKNCPKVDVTIINSLVEPKNAGFGESAPGEFIRFLVRKLQIPQTQQSEWIKNFLVESRSTLKYSIEFKDFLHKNDPGFYSPMRLAPDHKIIFNNDMSSEEMSMRWLEPDNTSYKLYDIWYELYKNGQIDYNEYQAHHDPFYWYNKDNKLNWVDDKFSNNYVSTHLNSYLTGAWLEKNYKDLIDHWVDGTVADIALTDTGSIKSITLDNGTEIKSNLYIDCTGFKRIFAKRMGLKFKPVSDGVRHNTAVVVANGYPDLDTVHKSLITVTNSTAMDYGWMFDITLLDRKSYGYVFNDADISTDQALEEMSQRSDPDTRIQDPMVLKWQPGSYEESWKNNYCLVGLASSFIDAFDASGILLQILQIEMLLKFINDPVKHCYAPKEFSKQLLDAHDSICERLDLSFGLAPRDTSEYWHRNHDVGIKTKSLEKLYEILNDRTHTPAAMRDGTFRPWQDHFYYNTAIYYGIDMSSRIKKSDPIVLDIAKEYFNSSNKMNKLRAQYSMTQAQWFELHGLDLNSLLC